MFQLFRKYVLIVTIGRSNGFTVVSSMLNLNTFKWSTRFYYVRASSKLKEKSWLHSFKKFYDFCTRCINLVHPRICFCIRYLSWLDISTYYWGSLRLCWHILIRLISRNWQKSKLSAIRCIWPCYCFELKKMVCFLIFSNIIFKYCYKFHRRED